MARKKLPEEMDAEAARCNKIKTLHALVERNGEFHGALMDSIVPMKMLLTDIAQRP